MRNWWATASSEADHKRLQPNIFRDRHNDDLQEVGTQFAVDLDVGSLR